MILVDSSVWIDYFTGTDTPQTDKLEEILGVKPVAIGDLILTEVLQGFRHGKDYKTCLLYTSDAADDMQCVALGGRRTIKQKQQCRVAHK